MGMRFTYPSRAANKKAETKSGGYAPKNRAAKPALRFRSRESIPDPEGAVRKSLAGFPARLQFLVYGMNYFSFLMNSQLPNF